METLIRTYSVRLLSPFVGMVQVASAGRARALSLDGRNWAIHYALAETPGASQSDHSFAATPQYTLVASIESGRLQTRALHPFLEPGPVWSAIDGLFEAAKTARLPFAAADRHECWLLDGDDGGPLALLHTCIEFTDIASTPPRPAWTAMPAAQLDVPPLQTCSDRYVPPVNYRLQKLVEERAGARPHAAWFDRSSPATREFPPCLIREDWGDEERQQLCDLYIRRLAPRLLMLQGLPRPVRQRLERAARAYVFEVERYYPLYPEVVDPDLMAAARVEARLRRAAQP